MLRVLVDSDEVMGIFDISDIPRIALDAELGPKNAFHISRRPVKRDPPRVPHQHEFFEVFWIASGSCTHFINGEVERLSARQLVFIRPDDKHAFLNTDRAACQMINIAFARDTADHLIQRYGAEFHDQFFWSTAALPASCLLDQHGLDDVNRLEAALDRGARSTAQIDGFLLSLMNGRLAVEHELPDATPAWLSYACEGMRSLDALRKGVPFLVELSARSPEHVARTFRQVLGQTPSSWVNEMRMSAAARMLVDADNSISEIALCCGVEDLSHFYKLFRQTHGISPMRFRRRERVDLVHPPVISSP